MELAWRVISCMDIILILDLVRGVTFSHVFFKEDKGYHAE
jgi:hypothetical protein